MKIIKTNYGIEVIIPETEYSSGFKYQLRNVRILNDNDPREQELLNELEAREKPLVRQFILRAWSMWNMFRVIPCNDGESIRGWWHIWEDHNRLDFNEYYHWGMDELKEAIDEICLEYCERSKHGWSF